MILNEITAYLNRHLTDRPGIEQMVINPCFSGVLLENGDMGISMNVRKGTGYSDAALNEQLKTFIGKDGMTVAAELEVEDDPVAGSVKLALINALSQPFMTQDYLCKMGYHAEFGGTGYPDHYIANDKTVAIVGYGGNVRGVSKKAAKVFVTELEPDMFRSIVISATGFQRGPICADLVHALEAAPVFRKADTILLTGCTLVTGTMEEVLEQGKEKNIIVYGCSACFYPAPLFQRGVNVISTRKITDSQTMVELLANCAGMVERFFPLASEELVITRNHNKTYEN
ncbi:MAG: hypothetical protein JRE28_13190 [Deltaproteobacteria bacterium]|nr:hypothetical protein [Deltaproteobacteria bacterium]